MKFDKKINNWSEDGRQMTEEKHLKYRFQYFGLRSSVNKKNYRN